MPKEDASKPHSDVSFQDLFKDAKRIESDTYHYKRKPTKNRKIQIQQRRDNEQKKIEAEFAFSDGFDPVFDMEGPLKWIKDGASSDRLKLIRKGNIEPELILDLHGMNKEQAKYEIAALIFEARKRHFECVCIMHGVGSGVLKQKTPSWLVQHPHVLGFHQSPLEWGGKGSLLVLIAQDQQTGKYGL